MLWDIQRSTVTVVAVDNAGNETSNTVKVATTGTTETREINKIFENEASNLFG
jgi:hypothetical protein